MKILRIILIIFCVNLAATVLHAGEIFNLQDPMISADTNPSDTATQTLGGLESKIYLGFTSFVVGIIGAAITSAFSPNLSDKSIVGAFAYSGIFFFIFIDNFTFMNSIKTSLGNFAFLDVIFAIVQIILLILFIIGIMQLMKGGFKTHGL